MSLRRPLWLAAVFGLLITLLAVPARAAADLPFRDPALPLNTRIDDLIGRLTLTEKISLLHQYQPAIPRLGIGLFKTGTEALHGVAWSTNIDDGGNVVTAKGTVFPQAVGLASTWDTELVKRVGAAVGNEARGFNAVNPRVWGLNLWAPVVNLLRDPRWGRNEEGYSEDPALTGAISVAYGSGIEGDDPDHLRAAPTLKHYLANNNEVRRDTTSSSLRPRVEQEYDQAAFRPAIAADAATGVMASYNLVNGRPATVNPDLNDVARSWTSRALLNVTDAGAPNNLTGSQAYYPALAEADAAALKAGIDSYTTDNTDAGPTTTAITTALAQGLLKKSDVDTAVRHILAVRFRLGEFDPGGGPYGGIGKEAIDTPQHRSLNRQTAAEAMVLLKNAGATLPLGASARKVAVIGPLEKTLYTDWYSGEMPYRVTPLEGIKERLGPGGTVTDTEGADRIALKDVATGRYVTAGTGTGAVLKEGATTAGDTERFDAFDWGQGILTLRSAANGKYVGYNWSNFVNDQDQPNGWFVQQQFKLEPQPDGTQLLRYAGYETAYDWFGPNKYLKADADGTLVLTTADQAARFAKETVASGVDAAVAAAKGADVAVVVVGSMPFINGREDHDRTDMNLAEGQEALVKAVRKANPRTVVVLENSYPATIGWEQANVPAILWTTHAGAETGHALADVLFGDANPAGRLTQTWPRSAADLPDNLDYDIVKTRATYLYSTARPLYPFGHGLSYTTFGYQDLRLAAGPVRPDGRVEASVKVTNTGRVAGDEVVQLYTHQRSSRAVQPEKQLRAFRRVHLAAGQSKTVTLSFRAADLALWDVTRGRWVVERSAHDVMVGGSSDDVRRRATLEVQGETIPARDLFRVTRAAGFDDYQGVELVDETKASGDAVGGTATGDWISFAGADLGRGATGLRAGVAATAAGRIEVRLGSPAGRLLGTATVPATGDVRSYVTVTAPLARTGGVHDVYLVFTGDVRVRDFALTR
ncbi:glycoside hydrolase family 3 protein [Sphaerisporangium corydalis]|uniref:Glycoside hydrolase family 3 C-terminal domain-containing protein n=1 Tax=Sphaerisporangium corydalis TaxID=1441875 RepID=A0ABV9EJU4_9ACTN|nr:glycoside hydrolase family 3 protein [Sphaerisporangium corydalis]